MKPPLVDRNKTTRRDRTLELLGPTSGEKILDVGCEEGFISGNLVKTNEVFGLDIHSEPLIYASKMGIKTKQWDIQKGLPFDSGTFDIVLANEILEHVFDTDALLSEIRRVLKEGGILILSVPNVCCLASRVGVVLGRLPSYIESHSRKGMAGHIRGYNLPVVKNQLEEHGFKIEDIKTNAICFLKFLVPWPWRFLRSFGEIIIVKARVGK